MPISVSCREGEYQLKFHAIFCDIYCHNNKNENKYSETNSSAIDCVDKQQTHFNKTLLFIKKVNTTFTLENGILLTPKYITVFFLFQKNIT